MGSTGFVSRFLPLFAVAAWMAMLSACGGGGDGGGSAPVRTVTSVTVTSPTLTPKQGESVQLSAVARDQFGDVVPGTATWSSSAPSVATVSSTGLLQALAGGSVVVTATISGVSGSLSLTVTPRVTTTVTVASPSLTPQVGETLQLTAVARDQFGDTIPGKTATWSSSAPVIATVSPAGQLQALAPGAVLVTATIDGVPGTLWLTVAPRTVAVVTVTGPTSTPKEGDTVQLTATARDEFGNVIPDATATWSSSDPNVAVVSTAGLVQTLATGTVAVTATVNGVSGTQSLTISAIRVGVTAGAKEVVFDYSTDRCEDLDLPDGLTGFVRAEDGSLVLVQGDAPRNYVSRGADFNSLTRDCSRPVLSSAVKPTPESYENVEWLWSVYREGSRWHALIHNEFHDPVAITCDPGNPWPGNPCWYNSITYAVSTDGGHTFVKPSAPAHVIAPAPDAWVPPPAPLPPGVLFAQGYVNPSNIVRGSDGYYYAFVVAFPTPIGADLPQGLCLLRTTTLGDPASWRAWDGGGFNLRMTSPYATGTSARTCSYLRENVGAGHIVFNTYLNRYMHVYTDEPDVDGTLACGFYFSLSADLIHWSRSQLLVATRCGSGELPPGAIEPTLITAPSIIDHADTTANFERADRTPHLYYTRFNDGGLDRDLVRVPLTLTRID